MENPTQSQVPGVTPEQAACGHEHEYGGIAYACERAPHSTDGHEERHRHAARIDAGYAREIGDVDGDGTPDLLTWEGDEPGDGDNTEVAWGTVANYGADADPPSACFSRVFLGRSDFACGGTPGHAGKHGYRLPWVTVEWDGKDAVPQPSTQPAGVTPEQAAEVRAAAFNEFLASQGYDDDGMFDSEEMEFAFETGWQIGQAAIAAQPQPAPELTRAFQGQAPAPEGVTTSASGMQPAPELAAAMAESRQLRTALRTLADLWDASSDKDEETARRPNRARLVIEERATTRRACAADIRKLAGPEGK